MKTPSLKFDFDFFRRHCERTRLYRDNEGPNVIGSPLIDFYETQAEALKHYDVLMEPQDIYDFESPSLVRCKGAYCRGGGSVAALRTRLNTEPPEDFAQFYEQFGESLVFTRNMPIWIPSLEWVIEGFEDSLDVDVAEGHFFPFAYLDASFHLGLRRNDGGDKWQVLPCWGMLYSEITGLGECLNPTFYEWLKNVIEADGEDDLFPEKPRLTVTDEGD